MPSYPGSTLISAAKEFSGTELPSTKSIHNESLSAIKLDQHNQVQLRLSVEQIFGKTSPHWSYCAILCLNQTVMEEIFLERSSGRLKILGDFKTVKAKLLDTLSVGIYAYGFDSKGSKVLEVSVIC